MDPKMIEMNNLRVLNDYLNQTIDLLARQPRMGQGAPAGFSPFNQVPTTAGFGTDTVYGPWLGSPMHQQMPFGGALPFPASPMYGAVDPFLAQRGYPQASFAQGSFAPGVGFGGWQQPWTPIIEVTRQAQLTQALAARQSVLEAMCRACGIPV